MDQQHEQLGSFLFGHGRSSLVFLVIPFLPKDFIKKTSYYFNSFRSFTSLKGISYVFFGLTNGFQSWANADLTQWRVLEASVEGLREERLAGTAKAFQAGGEPATLKGKGGSFFFFFFFFFGRFWLVSLCSVGWFWLVMCVFFSRSLLPMTHSGV